uniref:Uncharacterized protein n=1 Tax=viral metagenome TaxID=1070528 RepID=A0A6M3KY90_9ZZZZ
MQVQKLNESKFVVKLSWYGELHIFYTNSTTDLKALGNAVSQLAKRLKVSRNYVKHSFDGRKDNFKVERR